MIKILIKAAILVCIILSIYFIVNPSACSNLMSGRVVNSMEELPMINPSEKPHNELLTPAGDPQLETQPAPSVSDDKHIMLSTEESATAPVVTDTNSALADQAVLQEAPDQSQAKTFTQADIDYAIASRYVELENEYTAKKKDTKNAAKEISYIVMDDFELTPAEWEAFLQRATADNLFEKVRQAQADK